MSGDLPLVCICIPTYNAEATIREALASILGQTYSNLVIHISDNASTDGTLMVVESMRDSRVHIHRQEKNIGAEGNFNRCIQLSDGKYTAIFHADDIYEQNIVAKQVAFLESNLVAGAVFTEASLIDEKSNLVGALCLPRDVKSKIGLYDFELMFKAVMKYGNFFICPSFMVRTKIYQQEIKVWRADQFGSGADLDVWLRILQKYQIGHIAERLIQYRIGRNQFSAQIRQITSPSVLFKIVDYYLENENIRRLLDHNDWLHYQRLERRDRVMRAVNLFLMDLHVEAESLISDIFSNDAFRAGFQTGSGLFTLIIGIYLQLIISTGFHEIGKKTLTYMKKVTHR